MEFYRKAVGFYRKAVVFYGKGVEFYRKAVVSYRRDVGFCRKAVDILINVGATLAVAQITGQGQALPLQKRRR